MSRHYFRPHAGNTPYRIALATLLLTLLCFGAGVGTPAAADPTGYDAAAAERFVDDYTGTNGIAGAAYLVVADGKIITTGATGKVAPDTPMSVGSVSKSFTAFAVLQLVEQGAIALDAPITSYLSTFSVDGTDPSAITVGQLMSHTSGLPNPLIMTPTGTLDGDVAEIAALSVAAPPGSAYLYSNLNYRTLALLVQTVSGQAFDAYLDEHIFTPLGMDDTTSVLTVTDSPGLDAGHVNAYGLALPMPELKAAVGGAGGVISTAEDLGAWLAMQQASGVAADGTRLLSSELVQLSHKRQANAGTYAMGWQHTSTADPARIGHDGALTKYTARQDLVPSNGYATAVLLDTYTTTISHPFEISTGLIDISEGETPTVGLPKATLIDLGVGALTLLVAALGVRGIVRAERWSAKREKYHWSRKGLRLLPQAVMPGIAIFLFVGLTIGPGNPATVIDAFALWPAGMTLILVAGVVGLALIITRLVALRADSTTAG